MGEVENTIKRLNELLVAAGFAEAELGVINQCGDCWHTDCRISLYFNKDGNYIEAQDGKYGDD